MISAHAPVAKTERPPFGLSDVGEEEVLFAVGTYRDFVGLSGTDRIPDRVSILRFRHSPQTHDMSPRILYNIGYKLSQQASMLKTGALVNAQMIAAPSSPKNQEGERNPVMHQVKKSARWYFGMKTYVDVDAESGPIHTAIGKAAKISDVTQGRGPLHSYEQIVFADAGYQGTKKAKGHRL